MEQAGPTSPPRRGSRGPGPVASTPLRAPVEPARRPAARRGPARWSAALHRRRERLRADARANRLYRLAVAVAGGLVVAVGLLLVPLPGPGWLIVLIGLAVLGSEFHWARRLHLFARRHVHAWTLWVARQPWSTRLALGGATAALLGGVLYGWLAWQGLPGWAPPAVTAQLTRVPGLA